MKTNGKDPSVMVTVDGREVRLRGVSLVIMESIARGVERRMREAGEPIDPPTIKMEAAGGEVAEQPVTKEMIEKNQKLAQEFGDEWRAHTAALSRMEAESADKQARYMLIEGVVLPADWDKTGWAEEQERRWGVNVPTDPADRQIWYINTVILPTQADQFEAGTRINLLTRAYLDEELVASAQELFRRPLRGAVREALASAAHETEQMVARSATDAGGSGTPLGNDA